NAPRTTRGERGVNSARRTSWLVSSVSPGSYDPPVDPTIQATVAAVIGVVVGAVGVLTWHISDQIQRRETEVDTPVVPAGVATVLSTLRSSGVVVDEHDVVLKASAPAYKLGLVREDQLVSPELAE